MTAMCADVRTLKSAGSVITMPGDIKQCLGKMGICMLCGEPSLNNKLHRMCVIDEIYEAYYNNVPITRLQRSRIQRAAIDAVSLKHDAQEDKYKGYLYDEHEEREFKYDSSEI